MRRTWRALLLAAAGSVGGVLACEEPATQTEAETETEAEIETEAETETEAADEGPAPVGREPRTDAERAAVANAREAAQHLGRTLKTRLLAAMAEGGPGAAVRVCADEAQGLTARAAEEQGARVGRSSTKLRNPENRGPEWVTAWLETHGERTAQGVTPMSGIAGEPPVARFVGPIGLEAPCVTCHGDPDGISEDVRALLRERYPDDEATGYAAGDLRGAIWAEVPLAPR